MAKQPRGDYVTGTAAAAQPPEAASSDEEDDRPVPPLKAPRLAVNTDGQSCSQRRLQTQAPTPGIQRQASPRGSPNAREVLRGASQSLARTITNGPLLPEMDVQGASAAVSHVP